MPTSNNHVNQSIYRVMGWIKHHTSASEYHAISRRAFQIGTAHGMQPDVIWLEMCGGILAPLPGDAAKVDQVLKRLVNAIEVDDGQFAVIANLMNDDVLQ